MIITLKDNEIVTIMSEKDVVDVLNDKLGYEATEYIKTFLIDEVVEKAVEKVEEENDKYIERIEESFNVSVYDSLQSLEELKETINAMKRMNRDKIISGVESIYKQLENAEMYSC